MKNTFKLILFNQDIDTSFYTLEMTWRGAMLAQLAPNLKVPFGVEEMIKGRTINTYLHKERFENFIHHNASFLLDNPSVIPGLKKRTIKVAKEMQALAHLYFDRINNLSSSETIELLKNIDRLQIESLKYGTTIAVADTLGEITGAVGEIVSRRKNLSRPTSYYISLLTEPNEKSLTAQAYNDIQKRSDVKGMLRDYFWLDQGYIGRGLSVKQLRDIKKAKHDFVSFSTKVEKELKLSAKEKRVVALARDVVMIKALRADTRQFMHVIMNKVIDKVASGLRTDPEYLSVLPVMDVIEVIKTNKFPKGLRERWEYSVIIPDRKKYSYLTGQKAKKFMSGHLQKEIISAHEAKGQIAYTGIAVGRARLVFGPQHMNKVKQGDILVSTATSPQLLPAMKKAGAYVTDVGGITSHAAIVSRELKKPCVVGTKFATQIFKDGDLIEVDANHGFARLLKAK